MHLLRLLLAATCGLACLPHSAAAAEHFCGQATAHAIDRALAQAAQRSGGITADLNDAQAAAYTAWDQELNRLYAQVLKAGGPARRDALRSAQRAWLAFDAAQARWDQAVHADQGSSTALNLGAAALARRRARACDLSQDLQSLKDSP
jgi:uncharacterized protein YecT (DUF1311 family)